MTDDQAKVFGALSRGRLIFPFHDERQALHAVEKEGGLTAREAARKSLLDHAYQRLELHSDAFHSALLKGDFEAAEASVKSAINEASAAVDLDEADA